MSALRKEIACSGANSKRVVSALEQAEISLVK
jgi:hypothetical protein